MNSHPYVRAYMAGVAVPTMFLLVILSGFVVLRLILQVPVPIERIIVFPMAVVPNLFGLWNMLYVRRRVHGQVSIGAHGALLPFIMAPLGGALACSLGFLSLGPNGIVKFDVIHVNYGLLAVVFCLAVGIYYLVWKYLVNFFNGVVGIA
jgi:hypothetical protein